MAPSTSPPASPAAVVVAAEPPASPTSSVRYIGFAAGILSGLTKLAVGHPFDTIKTRLQCTPPGTYKGALDCLLQTIKHEGPLAVYKGATPPAVGWGITDAVLLGSLHNYRLFLVDHGFGEASPSGDKQRLSLLGHSIAGLGAGFSNAVFAHPIELLKGKLQLQLAAQGAQKQFSGPIDCARQVVRDQGVLGLWRGFGASLAFRSNFAFMFGGYELFMRIFASLDNTSFALSLPTANFLSGGLGANFFWLGALPADNVKNRIMTDSLTTPKYKGVADAAGAVWREAGLRGFYRGWVPVLLRASASALFVYETCMRYAGAEQVRARNSPTSAKPKRID